MLAAEKEFVLRAILKNPRMLKETESFDVGTYFNLKLKLDVQPTPHLNDLSFRLYYDNISNSTTLAQNTAIEAIDELGFKTKTGSIMKIHTGRHTIITREPYNFVINLYHWRQKLEQCWTTEGGLKLELRLKVTEKVRKFDEPIDGVTNMVLAVDDEKFYVCKEALALQSSYFKSMFFGNFQDAQKEEIPLGEVESYHFQNLLEVIHGEPTITDWKVKEMLRLADMYLIPSVQRACEHFLMTTSDLPSYGKFQLAVEFKLKNLKEYCLGQTRNLADLHTLLPENLENFDKETLVSIVEKFSKLQKEGEIKSCKFTDKHRQYLLRPEPQFPRRHQDEGPRNGNFADLDEPFFRDYPFQDRNDGNERGRQNGPPQNHGNDDPLHIVRDRFRSPSRSPSPYRRRLANERNRPLVIRREPENYRDDGGGNGNGARDNDQDNFRGELAGDGGRYGFNGGRGVGRGRGLGGGRRVRGEH